MCPNKNSTWWKELVSKVGEDRAMAVWEITRGVDDIPPMGNPPTDSLLQAIDNAVSKDFTYFASTYKDIFALNNVKTPTQAVRLFYERVKDFEGGTFNGEYVYKDGKQKAMFPRPGRLDVKGRDVVPEVIKFNLIQLRDKFGYDYEIVNDPNADYKGKYYFDGATSKIIINTAKATLDTPFHEYYHPFVRDIKENNPQLYKNLADEAELDVNDIDTEESIVKYISNAIAQNKKATYLGAFIDYVVYLFNRIFKAKPVKITELSSVGDVIRVLNSKLIKIDLNPTPSLEEAYSIEDVIKKMRKGRANSSFKSTKADPARDLIKEIVELADQSNYTTDDASKYYTDPSGKQVIRVTSLVGDDEVGEFSVKYKNREMSYAEYQVQKLYKSRGIAFDQPLTERTPEGVIEISFNDLVARIQEELDSRRKYGKMVHALMNYALETDPDKSTQAHELLVKYAKDYGIDKPNPELSGELSVFMENLPAIIEHLGLRIQLDPEKRVPNPDRIAPEVTLVSELLGVGTTADGLIQHDNGELSFIDWKTGDIMKDYYSRVLMDYGKKYHINDSKLSKAKLEMAFRALIVKEKFPDAKFRDITVVRLDNKGVPKSFKVDLEPYLGMIGDYYADKNPELHKTLKDSKLLDASGYLGTSSSVVNIYESIKNLPYQEQVASVQERLNDITLRYTKEEIDGNDYLKAKRAELTKVLLELQKLPHVNLEEDTPDVDALRSKFKNLSDVSNRYVQTLHKVKLEKDQAMREELEHIDNQHRKVLEGVLMEQNHNDHALVRTALKLAAGAALIYTSPFAIPAVFVTNYIIDKIGKSTMDVWSFMWTKSTETANPGWFLNTSDHDTNTGKSLTAVQKAYRDFVVKTMQSKWEEVMNETLYFEGKRKVTKADYYGMPTELPKDFMPRVFRSAREIREQETFGGVLREWGRRNIADYFTEMEHGDMTKGGMPVRFYAHSGSGVVVDEHHSFNVEKAFNGFMGSLVKKKYYDDLVAMAEGTKNALELAKSDTGGPKYKELAGWLDDHIYIHFLGKQKQTSFSTRDITVTVNKSIGKILGIPAGQYKLPADKLLRLVKNALSMSVMGFKLLGAAFNGLYITLTNLSQLSRAYVAKALGVPPDEYEPDAKSVLGGLAELRNYYKHSIGGRPDKSKLWKLAEVSGWMPDNFDFTRVNENLLSTSPAFGIGSYAYMFHNFVETYGSLWHLAMMLKSMKFKDENGKTYTAYDAYQINKETGALEWTKGVRGTVTIANGVEQKLEGLDALEWKNLRRQYEKLHGSYRLEEKTAVEATIWGEFVLQFKRYFPTYLKNLWASPYKDITVGKYVLDGSKPSEVPAYKWEEQVMEGRYRVLASSFLAAGLSKEKWKQLPKDRRKHLSTLLNTGLWFAIAAYLLAPDDDEKDTYAQWRWNRLVEDMSQGAKLTDVLHAVEKPVIVLTKASAIYQAMWDTMHGLVTGERTRAGKIKGLKSLYSSVPPFSNWYQLQQMADSAKMDSDYIFGIIPTKAFQSSDR